MKSEEKVFESIKNVEGMDFRMRNFREEKVMLPKERNFFKNNKMEQTILLEGDYSIYDFEGVLLDGIDFGTTSKLPEDKELFQKIKNKSLFGVSLPIMDLSNYNFDGVDIRKTKFAKGSKMPKDVDLLQKIKGKSLMGTSISDWDFEKCDFSNVNISHSFLGRDVKLPEEKDLFQKIKNNSLKYSTMPLMDYSRYDFTGVDIRGTKFADGSYIGTVNEDFFIKLKGESIDETVLPVGNYSLCKINNEHGHVISVQSSIMTETSQPPMSEDIFLRLEKTSWNVSKCGEYPQWVYRNFHMYDFGDEKSVYVPDGVITKANFEIAKLKNPDIKFREPSVWKVEKDFESNLI